MTIGGTVKPLVLFDAALGGDQTAVTGGWTNNGRARIENQTLRIFSVNSERGWIRTNNKFTGRKYLCINISQFMDIGTSQMLIGVSNGNTTVYTENIPKTVGKHKIDISQYGGGEYNIFIGAGNGHTQFDVDKVWLEGKVPQLPAGDALMMLTGSRGGNGLSDEDALNIITGGTTE